MFVYFLCFTTYTLDFTVETFTDVAQSVAFKKLSVKILMLFNCFCKEWSSLNSLMKESKLVVVSRLQMLYEMKEFTELVSTEGNAFNNVIISLLLYENNVEILQVSYTMKQNSQPVMQLFHWGLIA